MQQGAQLHVYNIYKEKDSVNYIVNCTNYDYNNKYTNHFIITASTDSNHLDTIYGKQFCC